MTDWRDTQHAPSPNADEGRRRSGVFSSFKGHAKWPAFQAHARFAEALRKEGDRFELERLSEQATIARAHSSSYAKRADELLRDIERDIEVHGRPAPRATAGRASQAGESPMQ